MYAHHNPLSKTSEQQCGCYGDLKSVRKQCYYAECGERERERQRESRRNHLKWHHVRV